MAINTKRVFASGLVAGLIIIVSGLGMIPLVGNRMDAVLESRSLPPLSGGAMGYFAVMSLVLGVFTMWIYALVRSNFGSERRAAVVVALIIWFMTYFWSNAALVAYGFMPFSLAALGTVWGLFELILASTIGAKLYNRVQQQ